MKTLKLNQNLWSTLTKMVGLVILVLLIWMPMFVLNYIDSMYVYQTRFNNSSRIDQQINLLMKWVSPPLVALPWIITPSFFTTSGTTQSSWRTALQASASIRKEMMPPLWTTVSTIIITTTTRRYFCPRLKTRWNHLERNQSWICSLIFPPFCLPWNARRLDSRSKWSQIWMKCS